MRKQLSMKKLYMMAAGFCLELGLNEGREAMFLLKDFLKYVWEHKNDDL